MQDANTPNTAALDRLQKSGRGYTFERVEGWVYPTGSAGKRALYRYWNAPKSDHFYTTTRNDPVPAAYGYASERVEGAIDP